MDSKISVIVPVYGTEKYLRKCLDSIINQTYKNLEIIIVNDHSPDNSQSIIDEYVKKDSRIISIINKKNLGLYHTRLSGFDVATGDFVAFVDSDDYLSIDAYRVMLANQEKTESVDPVLEAALDMANANFSLLTLRINGSEYVSMTEKHLINPDKYYHETVFAMNGVEYDVFDIKDMNEEEYRIFKESAKDMLKELGFENIEDLKSVWVSNVIDDVNFSFKHVFARATTKMNGKDSYLFKKYTFSKEDDQWKILTINTYLDYIDNPRVERNMNRYLMYDESEIEYINEIKLSK